MLSHAAHSTHHTPHTTHHTPHTTTHDTRHTRHHTPLTHMCARARAHTTRTLATPAHSNFVLCDVVGVDAKGLATFLRKNGVLVRFFGTQGGQLENNIRISAGRPSGLGNASLPIATSATFTHQPLPQLPLHTSLYTPELPELALDRAASASFRLKAPDGSRQERAHICALHARTHRIGCTHTQRHAITAMPAMPSEACRRGSGCRSRPCRVEKQRAVSPGARGAWWCAAMAVSSWPRGTGSVGRGAQGQ